MRMDQDSQSYRLMPRRVASHEAPALNGSIIIGLAVGFALIVFGAFSGGKPLGFLNLEGLLLVIGGTLASTLIQFSMVDLRTSVTALRGAFLPETSSAQEQIEYLMRLSQQVKERGILILEEYAAEASDEFLRLGLTLVVDGQNVEEARRILTTEMRTSTDQAWRSVQVWETMGNFAPAMGLIGTLIGLIQMLGALQDPSTVGPAMSMALVATLYGSISANLVFFPIAGKLRLLAHEREQSKHITLEGLMSVARLENPMMLEQRLRGFASLAASNS
jgi:chemotaxis protein MotA